MVNIISGIFIHYYTSTYSIQKVFWHYLDKNGSIKQILVMNSQVKTYRALAIIHRDIADPSKKIGCRKLGVSMLKIDLSAFPLCGYKVLARCIARQRPSC
jgi:hypothetical protein